MTLKVLLHEVTHVTLRPGSQTMFGDGVCSRQELEAESATYIVPRHLRPDTSSYSFDYLSPWMRQEEKLERFMQSLETTTKEARTLVEKVGYVLSIEKGTQPLQGKPEECSSNVKKEETEMGEP